MPPSVARDLFDKIVQAPDSVAVLRGMVNSDPPTYEDDWFDCKLEPKDKNDPRQRDAWFKKTWLRALSGFANNEGGVLVWGLDARKDKKRDIDVVVGDEPVTDPFGLKSKLMEWRRDATDPPLGNVQIEAYEHPAGSGKGFVVCHIPEGPHKPYRTREGDESQWYLRTSDNFAVMSPAILRAMFYPRASAVFQLEVELSWEFPDEGRSQQRMMTEMILKVIAANRGQATAKDIQLRVVPTAGEPFSTAFEAPNIQWIADSYWRRLPTMLQGMPPCEVFALRWRVPGRRLNTQRGEIVVPSCPDHEFRFAVYCENQEPQFFVARFLMRWLTMKRWYSVEASPCDPF